MNLPDHGANPAHLYRRAGINQPEKITDYSENVHPFGPPEFISREWPEIFKRIASYPDPDAEPFKSAAADFHGVDRDQVIAANGAAEIFTWLARRYRGKNVILIEPAFSEYRKTLEAEKAEIIPMQLMPEDGWKMDLQEVISKLEGASALYLCNPHNPTGLLLKMEELPVLAQACLHAKCELVIDEAFIDFIGEHASFISDLPIFPNVIIVRSMTKMYAIPGLRLGYAVADPQIITELKQGAAHWNVNGLSAVIGARCFDEHAYRSHVMETAENERKKIQQFFTDNNCTVTDSAVNFLSFQLPDPLKSDKFFKEMLEAGIVLRHTNSFRGMDGHWFRIGMKSAEQMEKLREVIGKWLEDN